MSLKYLSKLSTGLGTIQISVINTCDISLEGDRFGHSYVTRKIVYSSWNIRVVWVTFSRQIVNTCSMAHSINSLVRFVLKRLSYYPFDYENKEKSLV